MKKTILIVLASTLLVATATLASGSSGGVPAGASSVDPYQVTEMMKCIVTEIKADGTVMVRDRKASTAHALAVNAKTRFSARDKKAFGGRKALQVSDLKVGQELKVVKRQVNGEILRVKILKTAT